MQQFDELPSWRAGYERQLAVSAAFSQSKAARKDESARLSELWTAGKPRNCNYQQILDDFCAQMHPDAPAFPFKCAKAKSKMVARYGLNKNGENPGWRCYRYTSMSNETAACIGPDGELTAEGCSDPIHGDGHYCNRVAEMEEVLRTACQCQFQQRLDDFCSQMSPNGTGDFECPRAEGFEGNMVARYHVNRKGGGYAWRCYGEIWDKTTIEGCLDEAGEMTSEGCTEVNPWKADYCARSKAMEEIIANTACDATANVTTSTTAMTSTAAPTCNIQQRLDDYCKLMSPTGVGSNLCGRSKGFEGTMVARYGLNENGGGPASLHR
ncbi:Oidioi.mRNA.OKI2018_I69.XSR.g13338.t1.cds [Oikopleura dioica]|uniref:Oidioi.mRNA.OKI2018_I69.XSR.g13338.t1.cds n=1 Tax=Oikopleura dioica TaxID=34765 RepID=A0ABN7SBR9_OIKDI|nr:Oidioi.mRNA.OKI2018_I69.XSR.g13338.t1.cds [Oikopleura dioica]